MDRKVQTNIRPRLGKTMECIFYQFSFAVGVEPAQPCIEKCNLIEYTPCGALKDAHPKSSSFFLSTQHF